MVNAPPLSTAEDVELLVDGARYGDLDDVTAALDNGAAVDAMDEHGRTGAPIPSFSSAALTAARKASGDTEPSVLASNFLGRLARAKAIASLLCILRKRTHRPPSICGLAALRPSRSYDASQ